MKYLKLLLTFIIVILVIVISAYFYFFWNNNEYEVQFDDNLIYGKSILNYKKSDYEVLKEKFLVPEKFCNSDLCEIKNKADNKYSISIVQALVRDNNFIIYKGDFSHLFNKNNNELKLLSTGNISRKNNDMFADIPVELNAIINFDKEKIIVTWSCKGNFLNNIISRYGKSFLSLVAKEAQTLILKKIVKDT